MKKRSVPMRVCVGCEELKSKKELLRIVMNADGEISLDRTGKAPGRGAYICPKESCFAAAYKARRLERSLKKPVSPEVYEMLKEALTHE